MLLLPTLLALALPHPYHAALPAVAYLRADPDGVGTGFVVDADRRLLLTCRHLVGDRTRVEVFFPRLRDGKLLALRGDSLGDRDAARTSGHLVIGKVLRISDALDLALLELPSLPSGTPALRLADDATPGEPVWAVGHRGDLDTLWNFSAGVVRQRGPLADGYDWQGTTLATGAPAAILQLPADEGDSGGPVLDRRGEVVAVVSAVRRRAPQAAAGISSAGVRQFLKVAEPRAKPPDADDRLARATVWVRPSATETRTAGVLVDRDRGWVLTSAAGVGPLDRVGVAFPLVRDGRVVGDRDAYRDPAALASGGLWRTGEVIHRDPRRDLALVRVPSVPKGAVALTLAEREPDVGDAVRHVAHPVGLEFAFVQSAGAVRQRGTVTLSRKENDPPEAVLYQLPTQANAPGGPIVNAAGELLGVAAAKDSAGQQSAYAASPPEVEAFLAEARGAVLRRMMLDVIGEVGSLDKIAAWHLVATAPDKPGDVLALHPDCVPALLRRAATADDPIPDLDRVIALRPQHRDALRGRAARWLVLREPKKAAADLQRLLDPDPADADTRRRLAVALAAAGDEAKAAAEFARTVRSDAAETFPVVSAIAAIADSLAKNSDDRAANWLTLALSELKPALPPGLTRERIADALKLGAKAPDAKGKLAALRAACDGARK